MPLAQPIRKVYLTYYDNIFECQETSNLPCASYFGTKEEML